ncbi:MAG: hypothetical protein K2J82_07605 [Muribaculaceae bacterium]|nr:hypothetical protein [Muribaculaceae bacterium]MDE6754462.1 hypothetical protein [Muribaculaceae bacterium]
MSIYTKAQIPIVMRSYFMTMVTFFKTSYKDKLEFKELIFECSKLLNLLEETGELSNLEDKRLAAYELVDNIEMGCGSNKLSDEYKNQLVEVLTHDHTLLADSITFTICDLFDLKVERFGLE